MARLPRNQGLYRQKDAAGNPVGSWLYAFYDKHTGKRVIKTTGTDNLDDAKKRLNDVQNAYYAKAYQEPASSAPFVLREAWTLETLMSEWITHRRRSGAAENSLLVYSQVQRNVLAILDKDKTIHDVSVDDILLYFEKREKTVKATTVANEISFIIAAFNYAASVQKYTGNVKLLQPKSTIRKQVAVKKFLTVPEFQKLINAAEANRKTKVLSDYIKAYAFLGLRRRELFAILVRDVNLERGTIRIPGTKTEGSDATLPIPDALAPVLIRRMHNLHPDDPVFPERTGIGTSLRRLCIKAGIQHISPRDLRKTTGSLLASSGVPLKTIQVVLRHSSIQTTAKFYAHLLPSVVPDSLNGLAKMLEA